MAEDEKPDKVKEKNGEEETQSRNTTTRVERQDNESLIFKISFSNSQGIVHQG